MDDLRLSDFPIYHTSMPYWGIFPFWLRFIYLHGVAWSSSLTRCMSSWWSIVILSWSPSGVSFGLFSQAHTFRHLDIIMLLISGNVSLMFGLDSTVDLGDRDHTFDDGWFDVVWFSAYSTSDSILGHIFFLAKIYRSLWSHMIFPTYEIHAKMMTYLLSYHDLPGEPLLSHSIRLTPFGIWMSSRFSLWETLLWSVDPIQLWTRMARVTH